MGIFKDINLVLLNEFPDNFNQAELLSEFYAWLDDDKKNMIFVHARKPGYFYDLCNSETISISNVLEYWSQHIKKGIHNGEGFVIKQ